MNTLYTPDFFLLMVVFLSSGIGFCILGGLVLEIWLKRSKNEKEA